MSHQEIFSFFLSREKMWVSYFALLLACWNIVIASVLSDYHMANYLGGRNPMLKSPEYYRALIDDDRFVSLVNGDMLIPLSDSKLVSRIDSNIRKWFEIKLIDCIDSGNHGEWDETFDRSKYFLSYTNVDSLLSTLINQGMMADSYIIDSLLDTFTLPSKYSRKLLVKSAQGDCFALFDKLYDLKSYNKQVIAKILGEAVVFSRQHVIDKIVDSEKYPSLDYGRALESAAQTGNSQALAAIARAKPFDEKTVRNLIGHAMRTQQESVIEYLINSYNPNLSGQNWNLDEASKNLRIMKLLLSHGARMKPDLEPVYKAIQRKDARMVNFFLDSGLNAEEILEYLEGDDSKGLYNWFSRHLISYRLTRYLGFGRTKSTGELKNKKIFDHEELLKESEAAKANRELELTSEPQEDWSFSDEDDDAELLSLAQRYNPGAHSPLPSSDLHRSLSASAESPDYSSSQPYPPPLPRIRTAAPPSFQRSAPTSPSADTRPRSSASFGIERPPYLPPAGLFF
jgi:hypothetical protein